MKGSGLIFDDRGQAWSSVTCELAHALNCDLSPPELNDYVIRNLGFVQVTHGRGGVHILLRPVVLSPIAYVSLMQWLSDHPQRRAMLTTYDGAWGNQLAGSPEELRRALATCLQRSAWRAGKQFHRVRLNQTALAPDNPLRHFQSLWEQGLSPKRKTLISLCDQLFKGRFALSEITEANELIIREHGRGYATYSDAYFARCIGQRIEDDPDMEYGRWTAEAHRQALTQRQPLLEEVDVAICGAGQPSRHVRYQRIIAPLIGAEGRKYLLSASVLGSVEPL